MVGEHGGMMGNGGTEQTFMSANQAASNTLTLADGLAALRLHAETNADLAGLLAVLERHGPAVRAIVAAREAVNGAIAANDEKKRERREKAALDDARKALEAAGVSALMRRRATTIAAQAIGADPSEIDLDDRRQLLDKHGRTIARAVAASHLSDLPIGAAATAAGGMVERHFRDQLQGRAGALDVVDGKSGVKARREISETVLEAIVERAGEYRKGGMQGDDVKSIDYALGFAAFEFDEVEHWRLPQMRTLRRRLLSGEPKDAHLKAAFERGKKKVRT